ncbi:MAG: acyl-CoA thioester hydrolase [Parasphingorhabdus sp.]|jgi:acyl-CoA thioester hydrolase
MDLTLSQRSKFPFSQKIALRWSDYDMLGHINNVMYNRYIEYIVLALDKQAGIDWLNDRIIPLAVEVNVKFKRPVTSTEHLDAGLLISHLGTSSVVYEVALFVPDQLQPSAFGHFVHVFVDRETEQSVSIPETVRRFFEQFTEQNNGT